MVPIVFSSVSPWRTTSTRRRRGGWNGRDAETVMALTDNECVSERVNGLLSVGRGGMGRSRRGERKPQYRWMLSRQNSELQRLFADRFPQFFSFRRDDCFAFAAQNLP